MQRLNNDEGAIAVIVAATLVVLLGMGALVMDVGNLYWERRQLQNGADAAALAAAQDIVDGTGATAYETARQYADANNSRGAFVANANPGYVVEPNSVTVTTETGSYAAPGQLTSILASVVGVPGYATTATATASWGFVGGGATIPLTFSECEWDLLTGGLGSDALPTGIKTVYHHTDPKNGASCGEKDPPGGFGWLDEDGTGTCTAQVEMGAVDGDTGSGSPTPSASTGCTEKFFEDLLGKTVLMPIFTTITGTGSNATYTIIGFAAVEITGYRVRGGPQWTSSPAPCSGNDRCIQGRFVAYYDLGSEPTTGGTDFGAFTIGLTG
jgi:Flp pilus assembly protein TadG